MKKLTVLGIGFLAVFAIVFYQNCSPAKYKGNSTPPSELATQYFNVPGAWGECVAGKQKREIECIDGATGLPTDKSHCDELALTNIRDCSQNTYKTYIQDTPSLYNKVDIFLIVDDSSSMLVEQTKLAERFGSFAQQLSDNGLDWQACYTTTDVAEYEGWPLNWENVSSHILTADSTNYAQVFSDTIMAIGAGFSNDEQGIKAAHLAVDKNGTHKCFRSDAALSVIVISDEDERSVGGDSSRSNVQYFPLDYENQPLNFITKVKETLGADKRFNFNSIVVKDESCRAIQSAQESPGFVGTKYIELSNLSGGYAGSICSDDYSENLRYFKEKIDYTVSTVELDCAPATTGLEVKTYPSISGFSYQVDGRNLQFSPVIPANHRLVVNYLCQ